MVEPCAVPSIYPSPNARSSAARHMQLRKARRVKFAQHVKETLIDDSHWGDSKNTSFATKAGSPANTADPAAVGAVAPAPPSAVAARSNTRKDFVGATIGFLLAALGRLKQLLLGSPVPGKRKHTQSGAFPRKALFAVGLSLAAFILVRIFTRSASVASGGVAKTSSVIKTVVRKKAVTKTPLLKL